NPDFASKVTNGVLYAPNTFTGDTGFSAGVESAFQSIIGQKRIVPLYSKVVANGNRSLYTISEFAGIVIVAVDLKGKPKPIIAQPTAFFSAKLSASPPASGSAAPMNKVSVPPRLIIP